MKQMSADFAGVPGRLSELPVPVFHTNREGIYLDCNRGFEQLTGKSRTDILGSTAYDVFPATIAPVFAQQLQEVLRNPEKESFEVVVSSPDGGNRSFLVKYAGPHPDRKIPDRVIGMVIDVTPVKTQSRQALEDQVTQCRQTQRMLAGRADSLKDELTGKQRELASHLSLLRQIENRLKRLQEGLDSLRPFLNETGVDRYQAIMKESLLDSFEKSWIDVERRFDEIHFTFYQNLEHICRGITRNEKKLCAYLKMNLSSSDISALERKTLNSVNVAFSRLREKFQVKSNDQIKHRIANL